MLSGRKNAILEASLVTFFWSSSFIFIKIGLDEISPMTFAAYRYVLASLILLSFSLCRYKDAFMDLDNKRLILYVILGFCGYFLAQGLQFYGLYYLEAITVTFILNLTPIFVLLFSISFLGEFPRKRQLAGMALALAGVMVFFKGQGLEFNQRLGVTLTLISGIGWACYMVLTRYILKGSDEDLVVMTSISMFSGALMLLFGAIVSGGISPPSVNGAMIIVWLALANTALAFFLWNRALGTLRAYEQSILQNTMLIQISIMAMVFLEESLSQQKAIGIAIVFFGVLLVVINNKKKKKIK